MKTTRAPRLAAGAGGGGEVSRGGMSRGGANGQDVAPEANGGRANGQDVAPEVIVVGACDGFERVAALVAALLGELRGLSLDGAGRGVLRGLMAALARVRAGADAAEARVAGALDRLDDGGLDVVEVMRRNTGSSQREARRRWRRARALGQMPNVARALAAGDISTEHAEALARAAAATSAEVVDGDAELLAQVAGVPADRAGRYIEAWTQRHHDPFDLQQQHLRQRRRRRLNFGDGEDGMLMAHAAFDRVLGAQFRSLINGIADRIWRAEGGRDNPDSRSAEQRRLDALAIAVGLEPPPSATPPREPAGREPAGRAGAVAREPAGRAGAVAQEPAGRAGAVAQEPAGRAEPATPEPATSTEAAAQEPAGREPAGREPAEREPAAQELPNADEPVPVPQREPGSLHADEPAPIPEHEPELQPAAGPVVLPPRHQIVIVASADVISGEDPQGRCEIPGVGPIPLSELERLACDAELFGVLFSGEGEPLWHGRGERTATDAQRRALVARDGGCVLCADEPARCETHHVRPWAKPAEGPTDIDNLALLCGTCHRRLHNHRRVLCRGPDGAWGTAPDPRFTGRRKPVRPPGNGVRRTAASETSACQSSALEMTMSVGAPCLTPDVGRTSWDENHQSEPASATSTTKGRTGRTSWDENHQSEPASATSTTNGRTRRTSWDENHQSEPASATSTTNGRTRRTNWDENHRSEPASGPAVASRPGREATAGGADQRPGGRQRPEGGQCSGSRQRSGGRKPP